MLQNWPIRSKLAAILIVPLLTLTVLSAFQVKRNLSSVSSSDRVRDLAGFAIKVNDLVSTVQDERLAAATFVGSRYATGGMNIVPSRKPTDNALATYRLAVRKLPSSARQRLGSSLDAAEAQFAKMTSQRRLVDSRTAQSNNIATVYTAAIASLLTVDSQVSAGSDNADLVGGANTLVSIAEVKEAVNEEYGYASVILFLGQKDPAVINLITTSTGAENAWLTQFRTSATAAERDFYTRTLGTSGAAYRRLRDAIVNSAQRGMPTPVRPDVWLSASAQNTKNLRTVERSIANDLRDKSTSLASAANQRAWLGGLLTLLVLVASIAISLFVASPMIRHLRRLRRAALEVANDRLPGLVDRLQQGKQVDMASETFPIDIRTRDEIGQVAAAFATVHQVAVRTAVEQAAMRKSIGDTFLNLARRSQSLVHRQLKVIDKLERKETDPDELEELFRLDHLATRMRRHAEDLIVLSGSKPARGWRRPVAMKDVVRGAVAEVEDYTRVKVLPVTGAPVSGHAVGDVIHLLAELVENATSFSPPHTPVHISGHEVSNGCVVEIEDRGLGMTPEEFEQINHRLSNPPPFDLSTSERLGLFVVGRLAERHNIRVRLRPSPYGGTLAIVLLPGALLRPEDPDFVASDDADEPMDEDTLLGSAEVYSAEASMSAPVHEIDRPLTDDLPVFATVRSSWFVNDRSNGRQPEEGDRPALTAPVETPPRRPAADTGPFGPGHAPGRPQRTFQPPPASFPSSPSSSFPPPPTMRSSYQPAPPLTSAGLPSRATANTEYQPPGANSSPAGGPADSAPEPDGTTDVGLPKRTRRASLAPGLRGSGPMETGAGPLDNGGPGRSLIAGSRSPEEIRAMMSSFQSNFGRGLEDGPYTIDEDDLRE